MLPLDDQLFLADIRIRGHSYMIFDLLVRIQEEVTGIIEMLVFQLLIG